MNTKIFILSAITSLLCVFNINADEHKYLPMVREGVEWHYQYEDNHPTTGTKYDVYYRFDGAESVDGTKYNVLYRYTDKEFDKSKAEVAAYMRETEETESVYSICKLNFAGENINSPEQLTYDFATPSTSNEFVNFTPISVKSATVEGVDRKVIYQGDLVWAIEGIGMATSDPWWGYLPYPLLSMPSAYPCNFIILLDVKEIATGNYLYRYDNFFGSVEETTTPTNRISVKVSAGLLAVNGADDCSSITISDLSGQTIASAKGKTVDISNLSKGLYVVSATSDSGNMQSKVVAIR